MSTLRTFNLQNPDSGTVNIEMDQGGNTLMTGIATVRGAAHFTSTSGSDAVGIGTDITAYKLDVRVTGAEAGLRVYNPDTSSNASGILRLGNDDNQNAAFLRLNGSNNTSAVGGAGSLVLGHGLSKDLHLSTAGVSRQKIQSDGKIIIGGNVNQTANRDLSVVAASGNSNEVQIGLQPTNSSGGYNPEVFISAIADGTYGAHMYFKTRDTSGNRLERLRITSAGNIGIGEGTPLGKLHIKTGDSGASSVGASADELVIEGSGNSGITILSSTTGEGLLNFGDSGDVNVGSVVYRHSTNSMQFKTADVERLSIKSNGDFHIAWNDGQFVGQYYDANYYMGLTFASNAREMYIDNKTNDTRADILFRTLQGSGTPVERLRITSSGKIGVNNSSPDGVGIDVTSNRTTTYNATSDQRSLAHIIARNGSDAANRFSSISLVNGGGTQAEASINLIQAGNYIGHLAFKMRSGASSWAERLRIFSSGVVKSARGFLAGGSNGAGMIELASSSGGTVIDTGISVNASNGGGAMMVLASRNTSDQTNTAAGMYLLDFRYNGNHVPGVTFIGGDNICTFNKTAGNNLSVTCSSGNWSVAAFFGGYGIGNQLI